MSSFIEAFARLRICIYRYLFSWNPVIHFTCSIVNNGLRATRSTADKELVSITFASAKYGLRGCLHDTGATFAPERVHSGSLSWLYICLHDTITKCYAGASHPGVSSPRFSHRGENFTPVRNLATVSCKRETTTHFGVKSVCR